MRFGCVIFLFRSQIGRQLASLAFLASLLRVSPCLTVTFLRFWAFSAATILAWPRCTAWTGSAAAGRANAEARTAAPRPVTMFRRIVRVSSWAWVRAKESSSSCTLGWPDGTSPYVPLRHHAAARSRSRSVRGAAQEGRRGGALASGRYEPWRVEDSRRKRQGGRPVPLVGSLLVALGSSRTTGAREAGIRGDPGQTVGCPTCGEPNPRRARFCLACGDPLPAWAGRPGGTRKAVTVVVSDLSGSTAMGERLDPESLSQVMARYYEAMRAVVLHHGGTVELVGDAVHAVFGVPAAHEDDALRAVRAAAGMHAALAELNQRLAAEGRVRLEVHTGVNNGEVVAGDPNLGSLVVGEAVSLAARLEQAAGRGEILLGRRTWSLVRDAVEVELPQLVAVPGRRDAEPAYRLLAVRPGTAGRARRLDAPFVGRASELQLFRWAYERAAGEAALHLLTVLGGPGVGKTRLVLEAAGRLGGDPAVLAGRCLPYGNGSTFWPLAEVVRQAAGIGLDDPPAAARAKLAAVVGADPGSPGEHPGGPPDPPGDGALVAERIGQLIGLEAAPAPIEEAVWSTRRLLEALAAARPLVAVFDDLHWAEPTFLDLLEQLAETTHEGPILLVAVARPELLEQRPGWAGGPPTSRSRPRTAATPWPPPSRRCWPRRPRRPATARSTPSCSPPSPRPWPPRSTRAARTRQPRRTGAAPLPQMLKNVRFGRCSS